MVVLYAWLISKFLLLHAHLQAATPTKIYIQKLNILCIFLIFPYNFKPNTKEITHLLLI